MSTSDFLLQMFRDIASEMPTTAWLILVGGMVITASLYWLQRTAHGTSVLKANIGLPILGLVIWWILGILPMIAFGVVVALWKISNPRQAITASTTDERETNRSKDGSLDSKEKE